MKTAHCLRTRLIAALLALLCILIVPAPAGADTIDTLKQILNVAHQFKSDIPSGDQLGQIFDCLNNLNDGKVADSCKVIDGAGPYVDTVQKLVDLYVAISSGDTMEALTIAIDWLGDDAICMLADIILPGIGGALCDLLKDLVNFFSDIGGAVLKFLEEAGKTVVCALTLGLVCDDDNTPPEQIAYNLVYAPALDAGLTQMKINAYNTGWLPTLRANALHAPPIVNNPGDAYFLKLTFPNGLPAGAVNMAEQAYTMVVKKLFDQDMVVNVLPALKQARDNYNNPQEFATAFTYGIGKYKQTNYHQFPGIDLEKYIEEYCSSHFYLGGPIGGTNFSLVEGWVKSHPTNDIPPTDKWCSSVFFYGHKQQFVDAAITQYIGKDLCTVFGPKLLCPTTGNVNICASILSLFQEGGRCVSKPPCDLAGNAFKCKDGSSYAACVKIVGDSSLCGGTYKCTSLDDYRGCLAQGNTDLCGLGFDISSAGHDIAVKIDTFFKQQGSKSCPFDSATTGNKPINFNCTRPTQQYACNQKYLQLIGGTKLPIDFVNCNLNPTDADYQKLIGRVQQVVDLLKKGSSALHPHEGALPKVDPKVMKQAISSEMPQNRAKAPVTCSNFVTSAGLDPLVVSAEPCVFNMVLNDSNQDFGFGPPSKKPGFDYDDTKVNVIDGASTPVLLEGISPSDAGNALRKSIKDKSRTTVTPETKLKAILESGNVAGELRKSGMEKVVNPSTGLDPGTPGMAGTKEKISTSTVTAASPVAGATKPGMQATGSQTQTTLDMGKLPGSSGPQASAPQKPVSTPPVSSPAIASKPAEMDLPDLTATGQATIAGKPIAWGSSVTLEAKSALTMSNGACSFSVQYGVRNDGKGSAGPFGTSLSNSAAPGAWEKSWTPLAAGASGNMSDTVSLKPGSNTLSLTIDNKRQITESNKNNNVFRIQVTVNGACDNVPRPMVPGRK
jgi:hypothetical protein